MQRFLLLYCCFFFCHTIRSQDYGKKNKELAPFLIDKGVESKQLANSSRFIPGHKYYAAFSGQLPYNQKVLRSLNGGIYIITASNQEEWSSLQEKGLILVPVNNYWKLSPELLEAIGDLIALKNTLSLFISVKDPKSFIAGWGPKIKILEVDRRSKTFRVQASGAWLKAQALPDENIEFIALSRKANTERELTGFDLSANLVNTTHRYWPGITGKGLTVSIKENKMDTADIDFRGRYIFSPGASTSMQTHATTMTTIIAGAGNSFYTGRGVAWGSWISSSDFANLLPDDAQNLAALQVSVQNHSYGTGIENYYGADARAYDLQSNSMPWLLHVFSAGNSGNETSSSGNYAGIPGMANLTGSFKMAKNVLVVGAMDSLGNIPQPISKGPAFDGRVKPELVAFGEDGSSGAAAIVSGLGVLLQDAFQQRNSQLPPAALVKAILVNAAKDVGPAGIDFFSGYGAVNAYDAIRTIKEQRFFSGSIRNGESNNIELVLPPNTQNLKVTLCWSDPAAQANAAVSLVNDIDLEIVAKNNGKTWLPWVLNSLPDIDSLQLLPVRLRDSLNNIEQVTVNSLPAGNYSIRVIGHKLETSQQDYSVSWQYDTANTFLFTYPVKGDNLLPAKNNTIRWQTTIPGNGNIEYRLGEQPGWQLAVNNINLASGFAKWEAPAQFASVQFRMKIANTEIYSDTVGLSDNLFIRTGFNCPDSFLLYWQKPPAPVNYRLYLLKDKYLEKFIDVPDTSVVFRKSAVAAEWFTVAPILNYGIEGMKAYTFNYTQQQTGCYIRTFLADPAGTNLAKLIMELGTFYGVKRIVFEQQNNIGFVKVGEIYPVVSLVNILTTPAQDGMNIYRALIELENGAIYYTAQETVYQFQNKDYFVFPNPVPMGSTIRVMTKEPEGTWFVLYDLLGRNLLTKELTSTIQNIDISPLQPGVYFYLILKDGIRTVSNKLIVQ